MGKYKQSARSVMNWGDVAEVEERPQLELTAHADSAAIYWIICACSSVHMELKPQTYVAR